MPNMRDWLDAVDGDLLCEDAPATIAGGDMGLVAPNRAVVFVGPGRAYVNRIRDDLYQVDYEWHDADQDTLAKRIEASGFRPQDVEMRPRQGQVQASTTYYGTKSDIARKLAQGRYHRSAY